MIHQFLLESVSSSLWQRLCGTDVRLDSMHTHSYRCFMKTYSVQGTEAFGVISWELQEHNETGRLQWYLLKMSATEHLRG